MFIYLVYIFIFLFGHHNTRRLKYIVLKRICQRNSYTNYKNIIVHIYNIIINNNPFILNYIKKIWIYIKKEERKQEIKRFYEKYSNKAFLKQLLLLIICKWAGT